MDRFVESVAADGARLVACARPEHLNLPVPSCPGWSVATLMRHIGGVHRWATRATLTGTRPEKEDPPEMAPADVAGWLAEGLANLVEALDSVDPDAPTWHPFHAPLRAGVWRRRQAHETMIHRWDAERAIGTPAPLDPVIAADGVAEYFGVMVPPRAARGRARVPIGRLLVECTDTGDRWIVTATGSGSGPAGDPGTSVPDPGPSARGAVTVELAQDDHLPTDATLSDRAEELLLALWGRESLSPTPPSPMVRGWLAVGGH